MKRIYINTRGFDVSEKEINYQSVVRFAIGLIPHIEHKYDVAFLGRTQSGSLKFNDTVTVEEGMRFDVGRSDNA